MKTIYFKDLPQYYNQELEISGFVDKIRDLQFVQFVVLRDSSGKVQVTIEKNDANEAMNQIVTKLTKESTVKVRGILHEAPSVKLRGMELIPTDLIVTSQSAEELPIDILDYTNKSNKELRLDNRFLDLRVDRNYLIFKAQTIAEMAMREYWLEHNFIEIHSPKILGTASESGAEVFKMDYFGKTVYLAQSPQFYKQMAMAAGFNNVFEIAPAFRAENSHTAFHATEFTSVDCEISWIESHHDVMDMEEMVCKRVMQKLTESIGAEYFELYKKEWSAELPTFPRIPLLEAKKIIREKYHYSGEKEYDFDRREEELIGIYAKKEFKSDYVFVTDYPFEARPFYHMLDPDTGLTKSFDLIFRGVEITTGAQREHRLDVLKSQALMKGMSLEPLDFYFNFFRYGMPPHGGYGYGLTRFLMRLFDTESIRDVTFLYRGPNRVNP
ncbi:MAG: aspartate--tRNA(Asn) ligase [Candidatus Izemoplasmatales bacterium]|jgi:aspartyl-tRNA synthetase|nr:aspartate--tRNA(Asn) ligase [Candidatus Izemoplasmatales bacterium]MDD4354306.1 aspartate--tRNA(Asn) ligase [Candidatus Izemoplasmatales bacterium]MDD4987310.1 aspartate--tRNA(Asn) ligase [Candidatus Izemoplasmatales bacterium]MDY0372512.1 aspartate--tRNA(Asn) ligase [Candidatus Izemoplasmatales bacterium]NLF48519.1 aspartate--tRNA(Asn) ligase [Acholeplasmataceae bacterium]